MQTRDLMKPDAILMTEHRAIEKALNLMTIEKLHMERGPSTWTLS